MRLATHRIALTAEEQAAKDHLASLFAEAGLSPMTLDRNEAQGWLDRSGEALDGIVAKRREGAYEGGERAMTKVKLQRSADCVVGGFRRESGGHLVGSLLLGLYDEEGLLNHVGFTSGLAREDKELVESRLAALPPVREEEYFTFSARFDTTNQKTDSSFAAEGTSTTDALVLAYKQPLLRGAWREYATSRQREADLVWKRQSEHEREQRHALIRDVSVQVAQDGLVIGMPLDHARRLCTCTPCPLAHSSTRPRWRRGDLGVFPAALGGVVSQSGGSQHFRAASGEFVADQADAVPVRQP